MKCEQARELIDLCVHERALDADSRVSEEPADWAELDAHLAACPHCRAEFEELRRVRQLLATAANDRPKGPEVQAMWTAVQTAVAVPTKPEIGGAQEWWARNRSLFVPLAGVAAVVVIAFGLGQQRYGGSLLKGLGGRSLMFSNVDSSLPTGSADDPSGWGVPAHQSQRNAGQLPATPRTPAPPAEARPAPEAPALYRMASRDGESKAAIAEAQEDSRDSRRGIVGGSAGAPTDEGANAAEPAGESPEQAPSAIPQNLKIIKTGELTLEVLVYAEAVAQLERIVRGLGGFVADGTTREESGGALVRRIVIRMSPERFEETFAALKGIGRVASENVKAADVTAEYVDTEARIASLRITEERLRELIANKSFVDKIASLLEVEKELNRVRTEIEQMQGQLRVMADRVALSTIVVTIREPSRTVPSASLSVEVSTVDDAAAALGDLLAGNSGRLISGKTSKRDDGTLMGNYQIETALARFTEVVAGIEALGRVEGRQLSDQQFGQAGEPWAERVKCPIALVLFERSRQLPSATLRLEVDKLETSMEQLADALSAYDATMASNQGGRLSDGSNVAEVVVRVPAGRFGGLLDRLASLGRITSRTVSGETDGIVGGAAAVPCSVSLSLAEKPREVPKGNMSVEVGTFDAARRALSQAIADRHVQVLNSSSNQRNDGTWQGTFRLGIPAKEMEAFVGNLESLGRVAARQISGLGLGDLSRVEPDALGVLELTVGEKSALTPAPDEGTASIRARVRDALAGFYTSIGLIAYGLVVLLPWLLLALLLGWIISRVRRVQSKKAAAAGPR